MIKPRKTYDIFLAYVPADSSLAQVVTHAFEEQGSEVFPPHGFKLDPKESLNDVYWEALAEAKAFIAILTRASVHSRSVLMHAGAALSWQMPIYVLVQGISKADVPVSLHSCPIYPVADLNKTVVDLVAKDLIPFSDDERDSLARVYGELGIPADQLSVHRTALEELSSEFQRNVPKHYSAERLLKELFRMRMEKKLPKLT